MPFPGINVCMDDLTDDPRLSWISNTLPRIHRDVTFVAVLGSLDGPARGLILFRDSPLYCVRVDSTSSNTLYVCCPLTPQEYMMLRDYTFWWAKYQGRNILYDWHGKRQSGSVLSELGPDSSYYVNHIVGCTYTQKAINKLFVDLKHRPPTYFIIGWGADLEGEDDS